MPEIIPIWELVSKGAVLGVTVPISNHKNVSMAEKQFNKIDIPIVIKADGSFQQTNFAGNGKLLGEFIATEENYLNIAAYPAPFKGLLALVYVDANTTILALELNVYRMPTEWPELEKAPLELFITEDSVKLPIEPGMTIYLLEGDKEGDRPTIAIAGEDTGGAAIQVNPEGIGQEDFNDIANGRD